MCSSPVLLKQFFSNELVLMCVFLLIIVHCTDVEDYVLFSKFGSANTKVLAQMTIFLFFFFPSPLPSSSSSSFFLLRLSIHGDRIVFFLIGYLNCLDQVILYSFNLRCSDVVDARLINNKREKMQLFFRNHLSPFDCYHLCKLIVFVLRATR